MKAIQYRIEIDGLRALAVISVVIYHFFPKHLPYGFLGVDIFFVISGYLITLQIIKGYQNKNFSLAGFYTRRVKRIIPASFVLIALTSVVSIVILTKTDYESFFQSALSSFTLWSNIFFWRDGGYFGSNDELKPLLHMWSLSVEEQFYLIFPGILLLILSWRHYQYRLLFIILLIFTLSTLILYFYLNSIGGENPAFFLLPTRAWQFGFGALVAIAHLNSKAKNNKIISLLSIAIMLTGISATFSHSWSTLITSVGSAMFLYSREMSPIVYNVFSNKYIRFIGLISFTLYLYHWPIIVFTRYI